MRPGCKMLARVSFLAANFLSRDWHFPPHSRPGRLCFQGWALAPGYPETHTLGPAQPCSVDNIVIIRRGLWSPGGHSQTTALLVQWKSSSGYHGGGRDPLPPGPAGADGSCRTSPEKVSRNLLEPVPGTRRLPLLLSGPSALRTPPPAELAGPLSSDQVWHRAHLPRAAPAGSLTPSFYPMPSSVPSNFPSCIRMHRSTDYKSALLPSCLAVCFLLLPQEAVMLNALVPSQSGRKCNPPVPTLPLTCPIIPDCDILVGRKLSLLPPLRYEIFAVYCVKYTNLK